jgi:hypothetical protein
MVIVILQKNRSVFNPWYNDVMDDALCPVCHLPIRPEFYFCPNCGKSLREKPLSASAATQAWIYALSVIMPMIAYLGLHYWPGVKYLRSPDPSAKQIGMIAIALMAISTVVTFWWGIVWLQGFIQSSVNNVGNLGGGY